MTRSTLLLSFLLIYSFTFSQGLVERVLLDIPADLTASPSSVGAQIFNKSNLPEVDLFAVSTDKSDLPVDGVKLSLNDKWINTLHKKQDYQINIPVSADKRIVLKLYPYDIRSAGYTLTTSSDQKKAASKVSFYKGVVADDPQSMVQMTITDDDVRVLIFDSYGAYNLGQIESSEEYILYNDEALGEIPFDCLTGAATMKPFEHSIPEGKVRLEKAGECVKVYIEVDHASYNNFGQSVTSAENFALSSFAQVALLYEQLYSGSSVGIPVEVSSVKVWNTQDVYGADSNVGTALSRIQAVVDPAQKGADLVHLISAKNSNSFSGIAYVSCRAFGQPCKATTIGTNNPFAVSQTSLNYSSVPSYSWTVNVLAHEMGHNMGSPHTQACVWGPNENAAIDGCVDTEGGCVDPGFPSGQGTIMSYCHFFGRPGISFTTGFGSEVGNHIYDEYLFAAQNFLSSCSTITPPPPEPEDFCESSTILADDHVIDFESTNLGIWSNQQGDHMDWVRRSGSTPSASTGPSSASDGSNYYYIEASDPNFPNKSAILKTECLDLSQLTKPKFLFRYHMYGATMGTMIINILKEDETLNVLTVNGNQGDQWYETTIDLESHQNTPIQIEIIGLTGEGWQSDMAIDLLSIIEESISCDDGIQNGDESDVDCGGSVCQPCHEPESFCGSSTILTDDHVIDFESTNIGVWSNQQDDDIDWNQRSGSTPSSSTGPSTASEGSNYYYLESSDPNFPGKSAILKTECLDLSQLVDPQLVFRYHMFGASMGSMTVNIIREDETVNALTVNGNQGNQWYETTIDLKSYQNSSLQIEIIGLTGQGFQSDMAIDLLSIIEESISCDDGIQNGDETGVDCGGSFCQPCFACDANGYTVNSTMTLNSDDTRIIKNNIITNAKVTIQNDADIYWQAGGEINIDGQFEIKAGSTITLQTEDCSN